MTDIWCFTCGHEIRPRQFLLDGGYVHEDEDDEESCECKEDGLECEPR